MFDGAVEFQCTFSPERVVRNFSPGIDWSHGPDDGLAPVGVNGQVQLVRGDQRPLVGHHGEAVNLRCVQETDTVRARLQVGTTMAWFLALVHSSIFLCFFTIQTLNLLSGQLPVPPEHCAFESKK